MSNTIRNFLIGIIIVAIALPLVLKLGQAMTWQRAYYVEKNGVITICSNVWDREFVVKPPSDEVLLRMADNELGKGESGTPKSEEVVRNGNEYWKYELELPEVKLDKPLEESLDKPLVIEGEAKGMCKYLCLQNFNNRTYIIEIDYLWINGLRRVKTVAYAETASGEETGNSLIEEIPVKDAFRVTRHFYGSLL